MTLSSINRLYRVIDKSVFMDGTLDYDRITDAFIALSNAVHSYEGDTDNIWYIGEFNSCCLADLIVGAYWHFTEWHSGQWSKGYAALSALGQVFSPGMSTLEDESPEYYAFTALEDIAQSEIDGGSAQ